MQIKEWPGLRIKVFSFHIRFRCEINNFFQSLQGIHYFNFHQLVETASIVIWHEKNSVATIIAWQRCRIKYVNAVLAIIFYRISAIIAMPTPIISQNSRFWKRVCIRGRDGIGCCRRSNGCICALWGGR